jgi:hypothetical protein
MPFVGERRGGRRLPDVRANDLQEEMTEQRLSVPAGPRKTAATQRTSQRAKRAIKAEGVGPRGPTSR